MVIREIVYYSYTNINVLTCPIHNFSSGQMVQHQLHDVQQIQSAEHAFAAIRSDGRVVTWGNGPSVRMVKAVNSTFDVKNPATDHRYIMNYLSTS